jgi:hypothetical protein
MTALRFNEAIKALGDRLKERGKEKMVIIGAAMRKLLHICYGVLGVRPSLRRILASRNLKHLTFTTASVWRTVYGQPGDYSVASLPAQNGFCAFPVAHQGHEPRSRSAPATGVV